MIQTLARTLKKILLAVGNYLELINKKLPSWLKVSLLTLVFITIGLYFAHYISGHQIAVLSPQGLIGHQQLHLLILASLLSLIVVVPVFGMTFYFAWHYREKNTKAKYKPDQDHSRVAETIWWGVPLVLILILSIVTWTSSHTLDPFRPIASSKKPVTIQVVALQWKWLFIYPDQNIATVNYVNFPANTPINFQITSDAPMNSFWIPQLGGQVYAMSGMSTELHLMADHAGTYQGVSANISGEGFSEMKFTASAMTEQEFSRWAQKAHNTYAALDQASYEELAQPSLNNPTTNYRLTTGDLYNGIVMKYMDPATHDTMSEHNHAHIDYSKPGATSD